jgi:hypothetical protein
MGARGPLMMVVVLKPFLVFSFDFGHAEQKRTLDIFRPRKT